MRNKITLFAFVAALALLTLPALAADVPSTDASLTEASSAPVTLDDLFLVEDIAVDQDSASHGEAAISGEEPLFLAGGGSCGGTICGKGTYCCNASCGWCRPYGVSCIQIACN